MVNGTLVADGTPSEPIVFTSYKDDGYGGDTNGDGNASSPAAADWSGVGFGSSSTGNVFDHVAIRYAGYSYYISNYGHRAGLYIATSGLSFSNGVVEYSLCNGINVTGASPTITASVIRNTTDNYARAY